MSQYRLEGRLPQSIAEHVWLAPTAQVIGNVVRGGRRADIKGRGVDLTVNPGDCVTSPLWPKETFEALQSLALPTVRGNHDRWIEELSDDKLSPAGKFARNAFGFGAETGVAQPTFPYRRMNTEFWRAMARLMTTAPICLRSCSTTDVSFQHVGTF
jgi:hypothetical protein